MPTDLDLIGPWTEVKLEILREYTGPYSVILTKTGFYHLYIDAYAAGGAHISRKTAQIVPGSPLLALNTQPPFREYHFIDKDPSRVQQLQDYSSGRTDVHVHCGDSNEILLRAIFPLVRYKERRRALCLLDPYNIDLSWEVIAAAGRTKAIEVFVNFMVMDMNMNVLLRDPARADSRQVARMNRFWGDESWRGVTYADSPQGRLFGDPEQVKVGHANEAIANAYRDRLIERAGFAYSTVPIPFLTKAGATIYYLFFASPNKTGHKIVEDIFRKHDPRRQP